MWIVFGVIAAVVVLIGLALWWLLSGPDDDELDGDGELELDDEQFAVDRKWDWEFQLTEEQETALMAGLRAYNAGEQGPISVFGQSGELTLFTPHRVISLYLVAQRFVASGPEALSGPEGVVRALLEDFAEKEQPGVLHVQEDRFPADGVDGMDRAAFADMVSDVLMKHDRRVTLSSWNGMSLVDAEVRATGPDRREESAALAEWIEQERQAGASDDEAFEQANRRQEAARSRHTNRVVLDLGRVLDHYAAARQSQPQTPPVELLRGLLARMVASEVPGVLWIRPATDDERSILADAAWNNGE